MWLTKALNYIKRTPGEVLVNNHTHEITGFLPFRGCKAWGRRKVKMMTAHVYGRNRNCYKLAVKQMNKNLEIVTSRRQAYQKDFRELCELRIQAGSNELNYDSFNMRETLARLHIGLNRKVLANLAIWEPRSFRSIVGICAHKEGLPTDQGGLEKDHSGPGTEVISRNHL